MIDILNPKHDRLQCVVTFEVKHDAN